ncbi:hypothetical protein ABK040_014337 [Willaertia magna]
MSTATSSNNNEKKSINSGVQVLPIRLSELINDAPPSPKKQSSHQKSSSSSTTPRISFPPSPSTQNLIHDTIFRPSVKQIDATNKIKGILDKGLYSLPVSKDIPRLLKKINIILENGELKNEWKQSTEINYNKQDFPEEEDGLPKEIILYQLIESIISLVLKKSDSYAIPPFEEYIQAIDFNDHLTINNYFLHLVKFLESQNEENRNHLILLLKCCQQTIIINVLMGLREHTMKHKVHFKDARGAWKIYIGDLSEGMKEGFFVAHERSEQLYMKRADWMNLYKLTDEEVRELEKEDPTDSNINFSKAAMKQLFQFNWQIKLIFFKQEEGHYELSHVTIKLLGIQYINEDETKSHEEYSTKEVDVLNQYFNLFKSEDELNDGTNSTSSNGSCNDITPREEPILVSTNNINTSSNQLGDEKTFNGTHSRMNSYEREDRKLDRLIQSIHNSEDQQKHKSIQHHEEVDSEEDEYLLSCIPKQYVKTLPLVGKFFETHNVLINESQKEEKKTLLQ